MQSVFLELVKLSLIGSLFAVAIMLVRLIFRKAPKWLFCILWGVVALRLICPVSVKSDISLVPDKLATGQIITNVGNEYIGDVDIIYESNAGYSNAIEAGRQPIHSNDGNYVVTEKDSLEAPKTVAETVYPILSWVWVGGMALMITYTAVSYLVLRKKMEEATRLRENVWQFEQVDSPFVLGFIKPRIYLPYAINDSDMANVIAHEQAHIQRKDHWWKPVGFLLLSIHWFNPVLWLAYILLCRDIEAACDEKVIKHMDKDEMRAYSTALLHCSVHRRRIAACPLAFGEVGVKERIKRVMNYKKPAFWIIIAAVVACLVAVICFVTNPKNSSSSKLPNIHSHAYVVEEVTYESGTYSFSVVAGENSPIYAITEDMALVSQKEVSEEGVWAQLGKLEETKLTKENFDELFFSKGLWAENVKAKSIRKNTVNAWQLIYNQEVLYYVLQQKNGDLYLAYGYYDYSEKNDPYSDDTNIRWIYKLAEDDSFSMSGGTDGPSNITTTRNLTIDDVFELAAKGNSLTWEDLKGFTGQDIGSGLYVIRYDIDSDFCLLVGDGKLTGTPLYAALCSVSGDQYVDIMTGDVKGFIDTYRPSALDCAISKAIAEHYYGTITGSLFDAQSYVILGNEVTSGTPAKGQNNHFEEITVYLLVKVKSYTIENDGIYPIASGVCIPTLIRFGVDAQESYTLLEYWTPKTVGYLIKEFTYDDVREKFPESIAYEVINFDKYGSQLELICDSKALAYLNNIQSNVEKPLSEKYPEYFQLNTDKGLEVYVYQMAANSYSCILVSGKNSAYTWQELWGKPGTTLDEMRQIVKSYQLDHSQVSIIPIQMPHSSYRYTIDDAYQVELGGLFWSEHQDGQEPTNTVIIDSVSYDIDGDGKMEMCTMGYGPTSGLFSFTFIASPMEVTASSPKYSEVFVLSRHYKLSFEITDGILRIRGDNIGSETTVYFDIEIKDGHIFLLCAEEGIFFG